MLQRAWIAAFAAVLLVMMGGPVSAADLDNTIYLDVPAGRVVIELRPDLAPKTVARIKELARRGFYDGIAFHRVIAGFMAQTGDPKRRRHRRLGPEAQGRILARRITCAARCRWRARKTPTAPTASSSSASRRRPSSTANTRSSARSTSGMEFVDAIKKGDPDRNGSVSDPDRIVKMQVAADAEKKP